VIRPFRAGDLFLIQRLGRQATKLNTIQALVQPQVTWLAALLAVLPWNVGKLTTYVLHQRGHGLVRAGFLQAQKRYNRPEADIILLAPALDTAWGHPAIWEKLLSHYSTAAAQQQIARLYIDAPDQPLPVTTFSHVGFKVYTRQTVWRLNALHTESSAAWVTPSVRAQTKTDEWALHRLYARITPPQVQQAEGIQAHNAVKPPLLDGWQSGLRQSFVFDKGGDLYGCLRIHPGRSGIWLQLWVDPQQNDPEIVRQLIGCALTTLRVHHVQLPVYIGVRDYQGGISVTLSDFGFAPFTDRAKMVKHVVQWVRSATPLLVPSLERVRKVVPAPFVLPEAIPPAHDKAQPVMRHLYPEEVRLMSPQIGHPDCSHQTLIADRPARSVAVVGSRLSIVLPSTNYREHAT